MEAEILVVKPKLKIYTYEIIGLVSMILLLMYFINFVMPERGIYLYSLIIDSFGIENQWLRKQIVKIFTYRLTHSGVSTFVNVCILFLMSVITYLWLKVKTTTITFTNKYLEVASGILSRTHDNVDMVDIRDQSLFRSFANRIIGASVVTILSNDKSHPNLPLKLGKEEAELVLEFLKIHSTRSIVDYQLTRDLRNSKKRLKRKVDESNEDGTDLDV